MTSISLNSSRNYPEKQIAIHEEMKNTMGVEGILKQWNLSRSKYYYMLRKLKLNQDNQGQNENKQKQEKSSELKPASDYRTPLDFEAEPLTMFNSSSQEKMLFSVSIQESPQVVNSILKSVEELLHASNSNYSFQLTIREL